MLKGQLKVFKTQNAKCSSGKYTLTGKTHILDNFQKENDSLQRITLMSQSMKILMDELLIMVKEKKHKTTIKTNG